MQVTFGGRAGVGDWMCRVLCLFFVLRSLGKECRVAARLKPWTSLARADDFGQGRDKDRVNGRRLGWDEARACLGAAALTTQSADVSYVVVGCLHNRGSY
jgi:hypothetical protein